MSITHNLPKQYCTGLKDETSIFSKIWWTVADFNSYPERQSSDHSELKKQKISIFVMHTFLTDGDFNRNV